MARVSLIPVNSSTAATSPDRLASFCSRLEEAGHVVLGDASLEPQFEVVSPDDLVARVRERLLAATGDYLVVVDLAMAYQADDVLALVERLEAGPFSLVVAARPGRWLSWVTRRTTGSGDLRSGLVGLTQAAARQAVGSFAPIGSRFVVELLARVRGRVGEVEVAPINDPRRRWAPRDDIRHLKRIGDDRLGNLSRLLQFCFVGASGMVVDLSSYAGLQAMLNRTALSEWVLFRFGQDGSPTSWAVALAAIGAIVIAMSWNFSLNRRLTFNDARRGSIARQYSRYALSNLLGIAVSLSFRLLLPGWAPFFARHRLVAALAGIMAATGISFSLSRWFVFETHSVEPQPNPSAGNEQPRRDKGHDGEFAAMHQNVNGPTETVAKIHLNPPINRPDIA